MNKKGLNYWSLPGGLENNVDPYEAIKLAAKYGYQTLEFGIAETGGINLQTTEEECAKVRKAAESEGIGLDSIASGLYWSRALGDSDPAKRAIALEDLKAMLRIGRWLGAKTLLVIPGAVDVFFLPNREVQSYEEVHKYAVEGLHKALDHACQAKVRIGIENVWNRFLMSPLAMKAFIEGFDSEWIGSYLDVANVLPFGYPEQWLRIIGHHTVGIHFKDFKRSVATGEGFVDLLEGDVNWPEVMKAIKEIGYEGPVVAEMIPHYRHCPLVRVANASTAMDAILAL